MEQLASIQAVVKKAWNVQQNSQQKQKKSGDGKKDSNNNNLSGKKKRSDACYGCGGTGHFIKDCPNPHKSSLNSKRGERSPRPPPLLLPRRRQKLQTRKRILLPKRNRPQRMGQDRLRGSGTSVSKLCSI